LLLFVHKKKCFLPVELGLVTNDIDEAFAKARPFAEIFPEMAEAIRRGRGAQKAPVKELTSIRLDAETLAAFRATGPGWQKRMAEILREAAKTLG